MFLSFIKASYSFPLYLIQISDHDLEDIIWLIPHLSLLPLSPSSHDVPAALVFDFLLNIPHLCPLCNLDTCWPFCLVSIFNSNCCTATFFSGVFSFRISSRDLPWPYLTHSIPSIPEILCYSSPMILLCSNFARIYLTLYIVLCDQYVPPLQIILSSLMTSLEHKLQE